MNYDCTETTNCICCCVNIMYCLRMIVNCKLVNFHYGNKVINFWVVTGFWGKKIISRNKVLDLNIHVLHDYDTWLISHSYDQTTVYVDIILFFTWVVFSVGYVEKWLLFWNGSCISMRLSLYFICILSALISYHLWNLFNGFALNI